jgi:protein-tyrosine phosphatase
MEYIRPWLYIGKYRETLNPRLLAVNQIKAMLLLAELVEHPGIRSLYLPVEDFAPLETDLLRQGIDFVRAEKALGHTVLIACGAGINRSTTFAVAVLKEEEGLSFLGAFCAVKRQHSRGMPHRPVWESLCSYYQEEIPFEMLFDRIEK